MITLSVCGTRPHWLRRQARARQTTDRRTRGCIRQLASEEDGSEDNASEDDASEEDGSEDDASEEDGSEDDGSEEDGSEEDGSEEDGSEEGVTVRSGERACSLCSDVEVLRQRSRACSKDDRRPRGIATDCR